MPKNLIVTQCSNNNQLFGSDKFASALVSSSVSSSQDSIYVQLEKPTLIADRERKGVRQWVGAVFQLFLHYLESNESGVESFIERNVPSSSGSAAWRLNWKRVCAALNCGPDWSWCFSTSSVDTMLSHSTLLLSLLEPPQCKQLAASNYTYNWI